MARVNILLNFEHFISTRVKFNIIQFPFKGDDIRKFHSSLVSQQIQFLKELHATLTVPIFEK